MFLAYLIYYFKIGRNATETHTKKERKRFVHCMEKVLCLTKHFKSGLQSFVLEISHLMMLCGQVDKLKLLAIKLRH